MRKFKAGKTACAEGPRWGEHSPGLIREVGWGLPKSKGQMRSRRQAGARPGDTFNGMGSWGTKSDLCFRKITSATSRE